MNAVAASTSNPANGLEVAADSESAHINMSRPCVTALYPIAGYFVFFHNGCEAQLESTLPRGES